MRRRADRDVSDRHGVIPARSSYIVTHGTGTQLGDPVEVNALRDAFRGTTQRPGFCALTSTKTNFGHTFAASGLVSLICLVQSLRHGTIPASLHCEQENDYIDWRPARSTSTRRTSRGRCRRTAVAAWRGQRVRHERHQRPRGRELPGGGGGRCCRAAGAVLPAGIVGQDRSSVTSKGRGPVAVLEQQDRPAPGLLAMSHTLLCGRQHFAAPPRAVVPRLAMRRACCWSRPAPDGEPPGPLHRDRSTASFTGRSRALSATSCRGAVDVPREGRPASGNRCSRWASCTARATSSTGRPPRLSRTAPHLSADLSVRAESATGSQQAPQAADPGSGRRVRG